MDSEREVVCWFMDRASTCGWVLKQLFELCCAQCGPADGHYDTELLKLRFHIHLLHETIES